MYIVNLNLIFEEQWEKKGLQFGTGALTNAFKEVAREQFLTCAILVAQKVRDEALDEAIKACDEVDVIGADDCIAKIRALKEQ